MIRISIQGWLELVFRTFSFIQTVPFRILQIGFWHENQVEGFCLARTQFPVNNNSDVIFALSE